MAKKGDSSHNGRVTVTPLFTKVSQGRGTIFPCSPLRPKSVDYPTKARSIAPSSQHRSRSANINEEDYLNIQTWDTTVLGSTYKEDRKAKRSRRPIRTIASTPELGATAFQFLNISDMSEVSNLEKPDFVHNPDRYFAPMIDPCQKYDDPPNSLPSLTKNLKVVHDEKSLFPKYILEMEAKSRATHRMMLGIKRAKQPRNSLRVTPHSQLDSSSASTSLMPHRLHDRWKKLSLVDLDSSDRDSNKDI